MDDLLPPGFRFYPTEEELVSFYLHNKLEGKGAPLDQVIPVVDIYDHNPWLLPQLAGVHCRKDPEQWFFFSPMQEKAARGGRPNRLTNEGFWKATGSPGYVYSSNNRVIGMKRTMVFYQGRAPHGRKTEWKMNEYIAIQGDASSLAPPKLRQELSLCRIYTKSKTIRSFDRRPSGAGGIIEGGGRSQPRRHDHVKEAKAEEYNQNNINNQQIISQQEKSSSQDSSSSGDHVDTSLESSSNNNWDIDNMILDNQAWWDWEKVDLD